MPFTAVSPSHLQAESGPSLLQVEVVLGSKSPICSLGTIVTCQSHFRQKHWACGFRASKDKLLSKSYLLSSTMSDLLMKHLKYPYHMCCMWWAASWFCKCSEDGDYGVWSQADDMRNQENWEGSPLGALWLQSCEDGGRQQREPIAGSSHQVLWRLMWQNPGAPRKRGQVSGNPGPEHGNPLGAAEELWATK